MILYILMNSLGIAAVGLSEETPEPSGWIRLRLSERVAVEGNLYTVNIAHALGVARVGLLCGKT